jgi:quercetin dioxygenase-like cupin family protein
MVAHKIACKPGESGGKLTRLPHLAHPLLRFDLKGEIKSLHQEESWRRGTGRSSKTLAKYPDFRIVLVAMKAKTVMHEHKALARISIQALSGHVRLRLPEESVELPAGRLLALDCAIPHDVEAVKESAFLLTISWPHDEEE